MLRRSPGFTAIAVLTLALGIGANTAIFSVVSGVLLQPLPFPQPDRIVSIDGIDLRSGETGRPLSYPDVADLKAQSKTLESVAAYDDGTATMTGAGDPVHLELCGVSAEMFAVLRAKPMIGRAFVSTEDRLGSRVVILSHRLWKTRFGSDSNVTNKPIILDGKPYTIAGVMPPEFQFPLDMKPVD